MTKPSGKFPITGFEGLDCDPFSAGALEESRELIAAINRKHSAQSESDHEALNKIVDALYPETVSRK
jgi:hypothetical protein